MSGIVNAGQASDSRPDDEFYYAVQPNQMTYTDNTGVSRSIHIPRSKFHEACKHMENEDWEALSRYPTWSMYASVMGCRTSIALRIELISQTSRRS